MKSRVVQCVSFKKHTNEISAFRTSRFRKSQLLLPELSLFLLPFLFSASAGDKVCLPKSAGTQEAPVGVLPLPRLGVLAHILGPPGWPRSEGVGPLSWDEWECGWQRLWRVLLPGDGICGICQDVWCWGGWWCCWEGRWPRWGWWWCCPGNRLSSPG